MTKQDVIKLYMAFKNEKDKGNIKFRYGIIKNKNIISSEISNLTKIEESLNEIIKPINDAKNILIKKLGTQDGNNFTIKSDQPEKINEFNIEFKKIKDKHKNLVKDFDKKHSEYIALLQEDLESDFKFVSIKISDCPLDLKTESLEILMQFNIIK